MNVFRHTYKRHLRYSFLRGPAIALSTQLASFVAIKSLGADERTAVIISLAIPVGNLLAIGWSRLMAARARIPMVFWPDLVGFLLLMPLAFVVSPLAFVVLVFLATLLRAPTVTALAGVMRDNYPAESRAHTLGKVQSYALGTMAASGWLFGVLLEKDPAAYRWLFPVSAMLGLIAVWQLRGVPEEDPEERRLLREPSLLDIYHVLRRDRDFLRYETTYFIFGLGAIMYSTLLPLYLAQDLQVDYTSGAIALVVLATGLPVLTSPFWGKLIDRADVLVLRGVFNMLWALCPLLIALFHNMGGVYAGQILMGLTTGGSALIWNLGINIFARKEDVPTYMGIHQTLTGVRGLLGPLIGLGIGYAMAGSGQVPAYRWVFVLCFFVMMTAGILMLLEAKSFARKGRSARFATAEEANR